jgi:hypothetical protein
MRQHYEVAETIANEAVARGERLKSPPFYPAMNRMIAQLALAGTAKRTAGVDAGTIDRIRRGMAGEPDDFWSVVGQTELDMYVAINDRTLAKAATSLIAKFNKHCVLQRAPRMWASVYDTATLVLSRYGNGKGGKPAEAAAALQLLTVLAALAEAPAPE